MNHPPNSYSTVSKLRSESTARDLASLSCVFISRRNLVLHSVMKMVRAVDRRKLHWKAPATPQSGSPAPGSPPLTQVQAHTHEDDEAKPSAEDRGEVNYADDNIRNGGDNAEDDVAGGWEGRWGISPAR